MNKKYERYISYIVSDIKPPYFKNMEEMYGLKPEEYKFILSKLYDQPVEWEDNATARMGGWSNPTENYLVDKRGNYVYEENSDGSWVKREYDSNGDIIYYENSEGEIRDYR